MAEKTDFLAGLVIGTLVGIGLGILFAPEPGQKTRERLRGKADEMSDRLRDSAEEMADRLRDTMGEVGGRVRETAEDVARRSREAMEEGGQRLRGAYERGRDVAEQKREDILERLEESD